VIVCSFQRHGGGDIIYMPRIKISKKSMYV
jgi:hypothetical protein